MKRLNDRVCIVTCWAGSTGLATAGCLAEGAATMPVDLDPDKPEASPRKSHWQMRRADGLDSFQNTDLESLP